MSSNCTQSLENGKPCNAPAMNGSKFCRHHDQQRPPRPAKEESRQSETLELPLLQDPYAMLLAMDIVVRALAEGRIKRPVAETLISGIKFCSRVVRELIDEGYLQHEEPNPGEDTEVPARPEPRLVQQMAAAGSSSPTNPNKAPSAFSASPRPSAQPDIDSSTQRMIRELVAQSKKLAGSHAPRA